MSTLSVFQESFVEEVNETVIFFNLYKCRLISYTNDQQFEVLRS